MRFTAFDFETCSPNRTSSAVELGLCVYEDGKICEQRGWRFFPHLDQFDERTCSYSGIYRHDVDGLPTFEQLWPQIQPYFMADIIVAHNLWGFDFDVLYHHLSRFGQSIPATTGLCTCDCSRLILPGLDNYKLPTVCRHLKIPFSKRLHHSALFDAKACGDVFLRLLGVMSAAAISLCDVIGSTDNFQPMPADSTFTDYGSEEGDEFEVDDEDDEFDLDDLDGAEHLDDEDDIGELIALAEKFFTLAESGRQPDLLRDWAFAITGDVVDVRNGRVGLAKALTQLGAKCDLQGQNFAKTTKSTYGPTNSMVFTKGLELLRCLNGEINGKFMKAAETLSKGQQSLKFLAEKALYELVLDCDEKNRSASFDDYVEEELVQEKIRPCLVQKGEELVAEKLTRRKRSTHTDESDATCW